jgi:hypothetical protein
MWPVARLHNGSYNRTVFSLWSVPRLYNEIPGVLSIQFENKTTGRESQGAYRQDELIGGKPPFVK